VRVPAHPPTEAPVAVGVLEKVHDLHQLAARLVDAGDIGERHAGLVLDVHPGLVLANRHEPLLRAEAPHDQNPDADEDEGRSDPGEQGREPGILHLARELHVRVLERADQPGIVHPRRDERLRCATQTLQLLDTLLGEQAVESVGRQRAADRLLAKGEGGDLALVHERLELAVGDVGGGGRQEREPQGEEHDEADCEERDRDVPPSESHEDPRAPSFTIRRRTQPFASPVT
jgi:hypothetical protein